MQNVWLSHRIIHHSISPHLTPHHSILPQTPRPITLISLTGRLLLPIEIRLPPVNIRQYDHLRIALDILAAHSALF